LYGERTVGTLAAPPIFTGALTLFAAIIFYVTSQAKTRAVRALGASVLILMLVAELWSFSRASWLATLALSVGFFWFFARTLRRVLVFGTVLALLVGGGLLVPNASWAWTRLTDYVRAEERLIDEITSARMIAARPVLGWGFLQHNASRPQYAAPLFSGRVVPRLASHNTYLSLMADLGIPLFVLYVTPVVGLMARSWHKRRSLPPSRGRLVILLWLVALHLFIVSNFADLVTWHPVGTILWWLTLGLLATALSDDAPF
jgi:O-antigen ligase